MTSIDFLFLFLAVLALFLLAFRAAFAYGYLKGRHDARCAAADDEQKGGAE